jgi:hypothetical protein
MFGSCHALAQRDFSIEELWKSRTSVTWSCGFPGSGADLCMYRHPSSARRLRMSRL